MSISSSKSGLLLLLFIVSIIFNCSAQTNPINKVAISSPTAAALGKFGDIPVSYYTGTVNVDIPIYTVNAGNLSLPIKLSYHASGLKVQEPAGWCGAGWALDAGGVITRSVMGAPDEKGTNNGGVETHGHFSQYGYNNYYYNNGIPDWIQFGNGYKDGEPDLFFFNFSGYSGKFYFRDDRTPVLVPEQDVRIVPLYNETGNESIQGFILTTPDGVQYSFGNTPGLLSSTLPIEKTFPITENNGMSSANTVSSWFLNKVSSADGVFSIDLLYQAENYGYHTFSIFPIRPIPTAADQDKFGPTHGYELIKNIFQGVRLSQIKFPNGLVNLNGAVDARTDLSSSSTSLFVDDVNTTSKPLGSIEISDGTTVLRKFNFGYGYFTDNTTSLPADVQLFAPNLQTDRKRLRLEKIQEIAGNNSTSNPPYIFSYFDELVPRRMSFAFDHWGFSNGATANQSPIPGYTLIASNYSTNFTGADREAHWPAMRGGTLKQITYPTGGSSTLEFEAHNTYKTSTNYVNGAILNLSVHLFGQSATTNHQAFSSNGSSMNIVLNNTSNYPCTFEIRNSSNSVVYTYTITERVSASVPRTAAVDITLPQGSYDAMLTLNSNAELGTTALIQQLSPVQTTSNLTIGGTRVKTITKKDAVTSNDEITTYSYLADNGQSSSVLFSQPIYAAVIRNDLFSKLGYYQLDIGGGGHYEPSIILNGCLTLPDAAYYKSGGSIRPMATTQGGHIGYSQVKVSQSGNGYSLYKYFGASGIPSWQQNNGDVSVHVVNTSVCDINTPNFPEAPLPFDPIRGELQYEGQFNQAGQILQEKIYTPVYVNSSTTTPAFSVTSYGQQLLATNYELSTYRKTQSTVVEKTYIPGGDALTNTRNSYYESPFHHEITRISTVNSKGQTVETKSKYALDFRVSTCDAITDGISQYNTDCVTCTTNYNTARQGCTGGTATQNAQCLSNAYIAYLQCLSNARVNYTAYQRANFNNPSNNFKSNHDAAKNAAGTELKPLLQLQDNNENPVIEVSKWNTGNLLNAGFNRYDFSSTSGGKVYLNRYQSLNPVTYGSLFTSAATNGNSITKDSRYEDEATVKYADGNISEVVKKDGVAASYIWGYNKSFVIAKADGVDYTTLKTAYDAVGGNLITLKKQASLAKALISTYAYAPVIGITTETDYNNINTNYEYDGLQRVINIKDYQGNIVKNFQYNYQNSCGPNCVVLPMQTFNGSNTISYPVGVFNVSGQLIGQAATQAQYISLWNGNLSNQEIGGLSAAVDSMHFNLTLNAGKTAPTSVTGLRFYQVDLAFNKLDNISNNNGVYVDFGDGSGMRLGKTIYDTVVTRDPKTDMVFFTGLYNDNNVPHFIHNYNDSSLKTLTFYHNDASTHSYFDNLAKPGTSLTYLSNLRGNLPQFIWILGGSGYQQAGMNSVAKITNWSAINSIVNFSPHNGDGTNPSKNLTYSQDFMANNKGLKSIQTGVYGPYRTGYRDLSFKISRLKTDWNTFFTELETLQISEDHWNHEDLSGLKKLKLFTLIATTQSHTDLLNDPLIPLSSTVIDNVIIQVANGAGNAGVTNGTIGFLTGGGTRTASSSTALNQLNAAGWKIYLDGVLQAQ